LAWSPQIPQSLVNELRPYWRRRWTLVICAWIFCVLGWVVVALLPDRYEAMTRIYVETENLLTPLLRNIAVQADVQKQLEVLQRTLLNRTNMAKVAHATDLDLDVQTDFEKEQLYEKLAKQITVKAEGQNLFTISYSSGNAQQAKKVIETLLNLFVETNLGQNRTSMESARNFLENQISEYEQKLKQADQRLADYKAQHYDVLGSTGANYTERLDQMRQALQVAKTKYEEAQLMRDQLRAGLVGTPQFLEIDSAPQVVINSGTPTSAASPRARVQQLRQELTSLESRYTDQHPDVIATKRNLAAAEAQLAADEKESPAGSAKGGSHGNISNPVYEQLKIRVIQAEGELAQDQGQMMMAKQELDRVESLAQTAPKIEADLADLTRENGVLKAKYEELLGRRESARISEAVETSGDKVQFRVIEAPQVPARPSFPNRALFASLVLVAGFGLGGALIFLLHRIDDTVSSATDLATDFNVRVLGVVSKVETMVRKVERKRSGRNFILASSSLVGTYVVVMVLTQLEELSGFFAAGHLPAVLQRIIDNAG